MGEQFQGLPSAPPRTPYRIDRNEARTCARPETAIFVFSRAEAGLHRVYYSGRSTPQMA